MTGACVMPDSPGGRLCRDQAQFSSARIESAQPLRGRVLLPADLGADLVALWKQFCEADPLYQSPFYRPQFTLAVAPSRPDARVAVLEQGSNVVGFFPFHMTRGGVGKPIGGHINDYSGPILAPAVAVSGDALLGAAGLAAYDYNHMPSAFAELTRGAFGSDISPQMDLADGYEAYVARRDLSGTKAQKEFRRLHRKTESEIGPIRCAFHDPSDAVYRQLVAMKDRQYAHMGIGTGMAAGWVGEVLDRLRHTEEPDFAGVTSTLHAGDQLIAAHFGLRTAGLLHWWFPAYDLSCSKLRPGINLVNQCAMQACKFGIRTIDFGKGKEVYKLHFADRHVALSEGSIVIAGSLAAVLRRGSEVLVSMANQLPLGRFQSYPRRAITKLVSGVALRG